MRGRGRVRGILRNQRAVLGNGFAQRRVFHQIIVINSAAQYAQGFPTRAQSAPMAGAVNSQSAAAYHHNARLRQGIRQPIGRRQSVRRGLPCPDHRDAQRVSWGQRPFIIEHTGRRGNLAQKNGKLRLIRAYHRLPEGLRQPELSSRLFQRPVGHALFLNLRKNPGLFPAFPPAFVAGTRTSIVCQKLARLCAPRAEGMLEPEPVQEVILHGALLPPASFPTSESRRRKPR